VHAGRRLAVWTTRIEDDRGRLIAVVTQTQMVL
jgi:acyl-coenzyme A thioesterase PaaI-like protein